MRSLTTTLLAAGTLLPTWASATAMLPSLCASTSPRVGHTSWHHKCTLPRHMRLHARSSCSTCTTGPWSSCPASLWSPCTASCVLTPKPSKHGCLPSLCSPPPLGDHWYTHTHIHSQHSIVAHRDASQQNSHSSSVTVLCVCVPQVFEVSNLLGCLFDIDPKYPLTGYVKTPANQQQTSKAACLDMPPVDIVCCCCCCLLCFCDTAALSPTLCAISLA